MLRATVLLSLVVIGAAACGRAPRCDRLLTGGVVHLPGGTQRLEIAIADGRIVALVPPADAAPWRRAAAEVVDLHGAHVFPGWTESHGHLVGYGAALEEVDLDGAASLDEVVARVRQAAAKLPPGVWVLGRGWDQNLWPDKRFPINRSLSAAVADHPVLLGRVDGHAALANAAALTAAGITRATADPPGGRIVRDAAGEPTGVLLDAAAGLLDRVVPAPTAADLERRVRLACRHLAAFGITQIDDAGTAAPELAVLRAMHAAGTLPLRVYVMLDTHDDGFLDGELAAGPRVSRDGMLAVRAVKLFADGALGSRGALLSAPYSDDPSTRGIEVTSEARLADVVRRAARAGFQPCIHAIGDAAVTRVLDIYERELGARGDVLRPRVEHAQIVRPEDVPRFAQEGAIASVQPAHCIADMPWAPARLGPTRIAWAYRWRSLLAAGARLCLGSDVPVASPDPRLGMWAAVTRRTPEGTPPGGWNPAECLSPAEALTGYTSWAAFAAFEEDWRGRIAPGYAADLTVLDRDATAGDPAAILQAKVLRTVVAGRDVFVAGSGM
ncbi:MAG TPA: amidohydrolase [Thermoanaerobaculaceae bacterium]|nr:amidohydrolase [Thermoanaerobaculaceae bacterium]